MPCSNGTAPVIRNTGATCSSRLHCCTTASCSRQRCFPNFLTNIFGGCPRSVRICWRESLVNIGVALAMRFARRGDPADRAGALEVGWEGFARRAAEWALRLDDPTRAVELLERGADCCGGSSPAPSVTSNG
jgi:hypothetical protein